MLPCVVRFDGRSVAIRAIVFLLSAASVHAIDMFWSDTRGDGSGRAPTASRPIRRRLRWQIPRPWSPPVFKYGA